MAMSEDDNPKVPCFGDGWADGKPLPENSSITPKLIVQSEAPAGPDRFGSFWNSLRRKQ